MDSLGDRMKSNYEDRQRFYLIRRMPVIIRLDGKCFHNFTKQMQKPFSSVLRDWFIDAVQELMSNIPGVKCAYLQSDEVSILVTDYDTLSTQGWFDYNIQKIVSVSASIFTMEFNKVAFSSYVGDDIDKIKPALFDCRAFNIPREETCNYFVWRQKDWIRNSMQMLARSKFSHKELLGKNHIAMNQMLYNVGIRWDECKDWEKNGTFILNKKVIEFCPIFTKNRDVIENLIVEREDEQDI